MTNGRMTSLAAGEVVMVADGKSLALCSGIDDMILVHVRTFLSRQ